MLILEERVRKLSHRTVESLEKDIWSEPTFNSHLVTTCHRLRKKQRGHFEVEELRIMIGQNIGSNFLMPFAILKLRENILAEGDFYPGDLLASILDLGIDFWSNQPEFYFEIKRLLKLNEKELESTAIEYKNYLALNIDERKNKKRDKGARERKGSPKVIPIRNLFKPLKSGSGRAFSKRHFF